MLNNPDAGQRPLITFAILAFNQQDMIAEAIQGALRQTYSPLEILISDDCSTDATFAVMEATVAAYRGPHSVRLRRNPRNRGFADHINLIMEEARGELIVAAAGDDISLPERVEELHKLYEASGKRARALYSNATIIDAEGREQGLYLSPLHQAGRLTAAAMAHTRSGVLGCAHAWHRSVFEIFGPLDPEVIQEDVVIPFRAALLGEIHYTARPLVLYRRHASNMHFMDPQRVAPDALRGLLLRNERSTLAIFHNRLRDLETWDRYAPERHAETMRLRQATRAFLANLELEYRLFRTKGSLQRLRLIMLGLLHGTPLRRAGRWGLTLFAPGLYLRYQSHQVNRLRRRQPGSGSDHSQH